MKLKIAWTGKTREPSIQALTNEYLKRLSRYADADGSALKDESALLKLCAREARPRYSLVLLDGKGKPFSSEELADWLGQYQGRSSMPLLFAVGPADGFSDRTRQAATLLLSLGKMTLPHELARVVLLEQLYRAFTILSRHPYHLGHQRSARVERVQSKPRIMPDVRRGLIIVNTGPGKGKTTAAMGTGLRAVGQGMRVLMLQFLKGSWHYGELDAVQAFGGKFVMKQMGRGFVKVGAQKPDPEDVRMVEEAWAEAERAIFSADWDLVILDEINYAIGYGMLDPTRVLEALKKKPEMVHVILTGRNAHPTIIELADTVTEMRQVKHAYEKGVMAQRGIEY